MKYLNKIKLESEQRSILLSSFAAISGVGLLSYAALPFLIGTTMVSLNLNEASVGLIYSLEFLTTALSSLIVAPKIGKIKRKNLALIGASIVVFGNLASAWWCSYEFLLVIRPLTGIGAGLALACGNATIANAKNPAKIAGMMNVLFAGMLLLLMLFLPLLIVHWGIQGVFLGLVAVTLIFLVMLMQMPQRAITNHFALNPTKTNNNVVFSIAGIAIFAVFFMYTLRDSMAWGFVERIGIEVGYTTSEMGGLLSLQAFIGLLGPMIVALIGFKFGVKLPLLFGLTFAGLTTFAIFLSVNTSSLFEVAVLCFSGSYFFGISYLTAYAATLDLDGRIVAASGSAMVFGVAVGPALSGYLINNGGYAMGAWATLALVVLMVIVAIISIKWGLRSTKEGLVMKN
jgi:predicted MFS family arabinose efflux permease